MKSLFHYLTLVGIACGASVDHADAQQPPVVQFTAGHATSAIKVDGVLDDAAWAGAPPIPLPYEYQPGVNTPAPVATTCRIAFDSDKLYLGCDARDPDPSLIRASLTNRDNINSHDRIGLVLDPFADARQAFEFTISALGIQADDIYNQQTSSQNDFWDAIWSSAGRITDSGYVVEAAIPFKSLRFPNGQFPQTWRFSIKRIWPRSTVIWTRTTPLDFSVACLLCQLGYLAGFTDITPGRNTELVPTLTMRRTDRRSPFPAGPMESFPVRRDYGLDARWSPTTSLTANVAINPDFSNVEADAPQLDVNTRFALQYPEKRSLFLESADLFATPVQAVFTRTIADPDFATKLTARAGRVAFGAMVARDAVTNLLVPGNQGSRNAALATRATTAIARARTNLGAQTTIGALYTGRMAAGEDYENHVGGVDLVFFPIRAAALRLQALGSATSYPDTLAARTGQSESTTGTAVHAELNYGTRKWSAYAQLSQRGAGFRADAGFLPQVDLRTAWINVGRNWWAPTGRWYSQLGTSVFARHHTDTHGRLTESVRGTAFTFVARNQISGTIQPIISRSVFYNGKEFNLLSAFTSISARPTRAFAASLGTTFGDEIDLANTRKVQSLTLSPTVTLLAGRHFDVTVSDALQRLSMPAGQILLAQNAQLRTVYYASSRAWIRAVVQLRDTKRDPGLYTTSVDREATSLFNQLLFTYQVSPQSLIYLGYSDNSAAATSATFEHTSLTRADRTIYMKLSYALRP